MLAPANAVGVQAVDGGVLYTAPSVYHTQISHYCYPSPGVEMTLGDTPVVSCNRWAPDVFSSEPSRDPGSRASRAFAYLRSEPGKHYLEKVAEWEAARRKEAEDAQATEDALLDAQVEYEAGIALSRVEAFPVIWQSQPLSIDDLKAEIRRRIIANEMLPSELIKETKK